jgi:RNA polymerase sigma factor for flagellar operon FliA
MRLPLSQKDEFISAGFFGLIEAASRYDAARSTDFRAYAYLRIRGAIIDYIRSSCSLRGHAYRRFQVLEAAQSMREAELEGRPPSQADHLAQAKASIEYLEKVAVSFAISTGGNADLSENDDQIGLNPEACLQRKQRLEKIRSIVGSLPEKERTIIEQYYFHDRKFVDVAEHYAGLSKSWVSRLHDRALEMLREKMLAVIEEIAA